MRECVVKSTIAQDDMGHGTLALARSAKKKKKKKERENFPEFLTLEDLKPVELDGARVYGSFRRYVFNGKEGYFRERLKGRHENNNSLAN